MPAGAPSRAWLGSLCAALIASPSRSRTVRDKESPHLHRLSEVLFGHIAGPTSSVTGRSGSGGLLEASCAPQVRTSDNACLHSLSDSASGCAVESAEESFDLFPAEVQGTNGHSCSPTIGAGAVITVALSDGE